ncbi:MAG: hypothetical protein HY958_07060 [Bacteroidia bacterium]|nr:hypothetical protein [Bacteroidia bacterium]
MMKPQFNIYIKSAHVIIFFITSIFYVACQPESNSAEKSLQKDTTIFANIVTKDTKKIRNWCDSIIRIDTASFSYKVFPVKDGNYKNEKQTIRETRKKIISSLKNNEPDNTCIDSAGKLLVKFIVSGLAPYWYGTKYNYEGYTAVPGKGDIACGYFVSTILQDAGFNINRYRLAQQGPITEAKTLMLNDSVIHLTFPNQNSLDTIFVSYEDGLYFIGLDSHVGFLLVSNKQYYFIHSDYISGKVSIEYILQSLAVNGSLNLYIALISNNRLLIKKWLFNEEIAIIKT